MLHSISDQEDERSNATEGTPIVVEVINDIPQEIVPIKNAIDSDDPEKLEPLLQTTEDCYLLINGKPLLWYALYEQKYDVALALIKRGVTVQLPTENDDSLADFVRFGIEGAKIFRHAFDAGNVQILNYLIELKIIPEDLKHEKPLLHRVIEKGWLEILNRLINAKVDLYPTYQNQTPLSYAKKVGHVAIISALQAHCDPVKCAIIEDDATQLEELHRAGAMLNVSNDSMSYLHHCIKVDAQECALYLIKHKIDLNKRFDNISPIFESVTLDRFVIFQELVRAGVPLDEKYQGFNLLHYIVMHNRSLRYIQTFDLKQFNINALGHDGGTVVHYAINHERTDLIMLFCQASADLEIRYNRKTTLHYAIQGERTLSALQLIMSGADIHARCDREDSRGNLQPPIVHALVQGMYTVANLLIQKGCTQFDISALNNIDPDRIAEYFNYATLCGIPISRLVPKQSDLLKLSKKQIAMTKASPLDYLQSNNLISETTATALELIQLEEAANGVIREERTIDVTDNHTASQPKEVLLVNKHFMTKVRPYFARDFFQDDYQRAEEIRLDDEKFEEYENLLKKHTLRVEREIRKYLIRKLLDLCTAQDFASVKIFILQNEQALIDGTEASMRESVTIFEDFRNKLETDESAFSAWNSYNPFAKVPPDSEYSNLLTPSNDTKPIHGGVLHTEALPETVASSNVRMMAAFYFLVLKDTLKLLQTPEDKALAELEYLSQLSFIRNAYGKDRPSCYPGHFTRMSMIGRYHPVAKLPLPFSQTVHNYFKPIILAKFKEQLQQLSSAQEKEELLEALLELNSTSAKDIALDNAKFPENLLKRRKQFCTTLGSLESHIEIIQRDHYPHIDITNRGVIMLYLVNFSYKDIAENLSDIYNRHFDTEPTKADIISANPCSPGTPYYDRFKLTLECILTALTPYRSSIRRVSALADYLNAKSSFWKKKNGIDELIAGLEGDEQSKARLKSSLIALVLDQKLFPLAQESQISANNHVAITPQFNDAKNKEKRDPAEEQKLRGELVSAVLSKYDFGKEEALKQQFHKILVGQLAMNRGKPITPLSIFNKLNKAQVDIFIRLNIGLEKVLDSINTGSPTTNVRLTNSG